MRYAKEPEFNEAAKKLDSVTFENEAQTRADWQNREKTAQEKWRGCAYSIVCHRWDCRMFLGDRQRIIGITCWGWKAARFADAARVFFWPYRRQANRQLTPDSFNFNREQAESDLANNKLLLDILKTQEQILLDANLIHRNDTRRCSPS